MHHAMLLEGLRQSALNIIGKEEKVAIAYSGGIDSSIIAALADEMADVKCYCAAVPRSHDARTVRASADGEGRALEFIEISDRDLRQLAIQASALVEGSKPVPIAYTIPLMAVMGAALERVILAGNGADELFGGYAKYLASSDLLKDMETDLEKAMSEAERVKRYSLERGKTFGFPFLSEQVLELARSMPMEEKIRGPSRKLVLKKVARELGLPSEHRPKKAAQYSSGVLKRMGKLAKAEGVSIEDWCASLRRSD